MGDRTEAARVAVTFEQFAVRQSKGLLTLAIAMSGDSHLAEDIVQEVMIRVHARWDRIGGLDDPPSYVRKMVTNEYLSWRRKWSRVVPFADATIFERASDGSDEATTLAERDELVHRLATLTRRQRAVLALRFYEGMTDSQIAAILGCGEGSVRTHASRGLAALRIRSDDGGSRSDPPVAPDPNRWQPGKEAS